MIHGGLLDSMSSMYMDWLERHPLLTKSLTASSISLLSNLVSQTTSGQQEQATGLQTPGKRGRTKYNRRELLKYLLFGLLWVGPSSHFWQNALERLIPRRPRETRGSWALRKMLCDQLCFGPVGNVVFISFIGCAIQGLGVGGTVRKVREEYVATQVSGWLVWPLASVCNQYYVPIELRVGFLNVVAFFWSMYMMSGKGKKKMQ